MPRSTAPIAFALIVVMVGGLSVAFPHEDLDVSVVAYVGADPADDPGDWPTGTDLSDRLLRDASIRIVAGRGSGRETASSGSASFYLDNTDGALTPLNPKSAYFETWDIGVPMALDLTNVGSSPPHGIFRGYVVDIEAEVAPGADGEMVSAVRVTLGGLIRRLSQGAVPKSAIRRAVLASAPLAYWPLEDGREAEQAGGGQAGVSAMQVVGGDITFAQDESLPGSTSTPDMSAGALRGSVPSNGSSASWHIEFWVSAEYNTGSRAAYFTTSSPGLETWGLRQPASSSGSWEAFVFDSSGGVVQTIAGPVTDWDAGAGTWHHFAITAEQTGSNVTVRMYSDGAIVVQDIISSVTLGRVKDVYANDFDAFEFADLLSISHIAVGDGVTFSDSYLAGDAYSGETDSARVTRICAEEGLPVTVAFGDGIPLGPQPVSTALGVLRDAETVGHGILSEDTTTWGFVYRPLSNRYNQAAALTIDLDTYRTSEGGSRDVLRPVRNDQRLRNRWTVIRPNGAEATAEDAASIAKRGLYDDSAEVNVARDADLAGEARWRLRESTLPGNRYGTVPLDLAANPTLVGDWLDLSLGDRIDRTNHPPGIHLPDTVSLTAEGYTQTIDPRRWRVDLVSEPYELYQVGTYSATDVDLDDRPARYDTDWSTTSGDFEAGTDTSLTVATSAGPLWTTDTDSLPLQILVYGCPLTVTAISGTSSPQTFTVSTTLPDPSLDGLTIPSGSEVHVRDRGFYAL